MRIKTAALAALAIAGLTLAPITAHAETAPEPPESIGVGMMDEHGPEWGQPGDPLPEGMEHIDHDRQQAELEALSPQGNLGDDTGMLEDIEHNIGDDAPDTVIEYGPEQAPTESSPDDTLAPKAETPAPKAETPAPKAETPAPKAETPAPKATTRPALPKTGN